MILRELHCGEIVMSAAEVLALGAMDLRMKVIVGQVPACGDKSAPADEDEKLFNEMVNYFNKGDFSAKPDNNFRASSSRII